jgi:hypothetical protein
LGAKTPWKRIRLTRGLGTKAANRAMKSSGLHRLRSQRSGEPGGEKNLLREEAA